jgi:hypothetical protein
VGYPRTFSRHEEPIVHVLTKIFVVLVALLAVVLVPLVVVYAHNENSYQARYQAAEARAAAAGGALEAAKASEGAARARSEAEKEGMSQENLRLQADVTRLETDLRSKELELTSARQMDQDIDARLSTLALALESGQNLTNSLIDEVRGLRKDALTSERRAVDLDEQLRDVNSKLEVAVAARRALAEELQRVKEENAQALSKIAQYVAKYPQINDEVAASGVMSGIYPDVSLDAHIVNVRRSADQDLAEIDAGSRDGVKEGWLMTIASAGDYVATLRIIKVDINRSTGVIQLEENTPGKVEVGQMVYARPRR